MFGLLLFLYLIGVPFTIGFFWQASDEWDAGPCVALGFIWPAVPLMTLGVKVAEWLKVRVCV